MRGIIEKTAYFSHNKIIFPFYGAKVQIKKAPIISLLIDTFLLNMIDTESNNKKSNTKILKSFFMVFLYFCDIKKKLRNISQHLTLL